MSRLRWNVVALSWSTSAVTVGVSLWLSVGGCGSSGSSHTTPGFVPVFTVGDGGSSGVVSTTGNTQGSTQGSTSGVVTSSAATTGGNPTSSGSVAASSSSTPSCVTDTGPITGSVSKTGGTLSRLVFAVVGDTRPTNEDDPSNYPTAIISKIFEDIEAQSPRPPIVVGTGDYQFSSTGSNSTGAEQVTTYMQSRAKYTGAFFPAMGNHECGVSGSFTTSDNNNCGPGNAGGVTPNYTAFINQMMAPIGQTNPYYSVNVNAADGSWTAKFVVTAANSWSTAQQSWLDGVLSQKTTYTFVMRHEATDATPPLPPGVAGVDAELAKYPYTLLIVGHAHTYGHWSDAPQSITIGNGGAPLSSKDYGYGLISQRCDGALVVDEIDYQSGAVDSSFHFVITGAGAITH